MYRSNFLPWCPLASLDFVHLSLRPVYKLLLDTILFAAMTEIWYSKRITHDDGLLS